MSERYKLQSLFARGGMAEVYLGTVMGAEGFEKPVAIKRILPHLAADPKVARMFTAEAKVASFLHHQNIVQTSDVGQGPDGLYIVMELIHGWDLGVLIECATRHGTLFPGPLVAYVGLQVLAGLSHAYKKKVQGKRLIAAHRDISPSNVMISTEGEVKVADFGIARMEGLATHGTEPGTFKGKVAYASPEMLRGEPATMLSDQFSLGIVFHEMLTGQHPFGDADNLVGYIEKLQKDLLFPLPGVPVELANIVRKMLSRQAEARFQSPELLSKALSQYMALSQSHVTAADLAEFLQGCSPPPPVGERPVPEAQQTQSDTIIRASFSLHGAAAPSPAQVQNLMSELYDPDWKPTGPVMDISGKLEGHAAHVAPQVQRAPRTTSRPKPPQEEPLELDFRRAAPPTQVHTELPDVADISVLREAQRAQASKKSLKAVFAWAAALLIVAGLVRNFWPVIMDKLQGQNIPKALAAKLPISRTHVLQVNSEPPGATVKINGTDVGTTPYLTENIYPDAVVDVTVGLSGYHLWKGTFRGGTDAEVQATLRR